MSKEKALNAFSTSTEVAENKVLIAPLNWGLGHATRCIPIIRFLEENKFTPIIASDGVALVFLKKEFPNLQTLELPSYNIRYSKFGFLLKWKLIASFFSILKAVQQEQKLIADFVEKENIVGIISDNRFGVFHTEISSVYITHQLQVFSGITTLFSSKLHQKIISKFDCCWVPDSKGDKSLSGELSQANFSKTPISFIGNISRLIFEEKEKEYDLLVLLSGPEPQRTLFEENLYQQLENYKGKVLFVRGVLDAVELIPLNKNIQFVNYLKTAELQDAINSSELVLCRSGYSTIMDLGKLKKKAFFVPTPGQTEQIYLANYLAEKKIAPFCKQEQFELNMLAKINNYTGFMENYQSELNSDLLRVFKKD
jgi:UDP-N-acetylglucosamine transferase subunit ALG13